MCFCYSKFSTPEAYKPAPVGNYEQASLCRIPGLCLKTFLLELNDVAIFIFRFAGMGNLIKVLTRDIDHNAAHFFLDFESKSLSPSRLVHNGKGERLIILTPQWRPARLFVNKVWGSNKVCMTFFLIVGKHHHHMYNLVFHLLKSCWVCSQCCPFISPWSK